MAAAAAAEDLEHATQQLESLQIDSEEAAGDGTAEGSAEADGATVEGESTVSADASHTPSSPDPPPSVDHALLDALRHPKNRSSVLALEVEVEEFLRGSDQPQHIFSSDMSSYERLLAHRTAQHWGLETTTINQGPDQGRILAVRTPATRAPKVRLRDVEVTMQEPQQLGGAPRMGGPPVGSPPAPRVLVRKRSDRLPRGVGPGGMMGPGMEGAYGANGQFRSMQEREQEYHRARARIFGEVSPTHGPGAGYSGPAGGAPMVPSPRAGAGPGPLNGAGPGGGSGVMGGGMATPFGMMGAQMAHMAYGAAAGLGRGVAGGMPYGAMQPGSYVPGGGPGGGPAAYAAYGQYMAGGYGGPRPAKAQLRNKEADMADPDFRRGRALHGNRFDPGFGEDQQGGMYARPTYGSEFPEMAGGSGAAAEGSRPGGPGGRPAQSPRSNGAAGGMMGPMGGAPMPTSPAAAAAAMYAGGYGGQMGASGMGGHPEMMAMGYGYGQGMMPAGAMMAHMPGMMYQSAGGGAMPYGMVAVPPYGYMAVRPGQQEAMMQAYAAAGMGVAYAPYGGGQAAMGMAMGPMGGMQGPMTPSAAASLTRRPSGGGGRYAGPRPSSSGGPRPGPPTPRADSFGQERQHALSAAAAAAAVAAAHQHSSPQHQPASPASPAAAQHAQLPEGQPASPSAAQVAPAE